MSWIKRNLSLVISGVVALGLLGLGGWYLYAAIDKNKTVDNEISSTKAEIDRLLNAPVTPNDANLKLAKQEAAKIAAFIADAKRQFPPTPPPPVALNNQSFKELLQTTIDGLTKQATTVGIRVPTNYYYSFESQRGPVRFPPGSLRPLADQLNEIERMVSILFKSRIHRLEGLRRALAPEEEQAPNTATDYLTVPARGHAETGMALWPYEVTFDCFTAELGAVLEALARAESGFIVKAPVVEALPDLSQAALKPPVGPPGRPVAPVQPLTTVINERLLRVTLRLEVIKPAR